jgi:hypothetical protein
LVLNGNELVRGVDLAAQRGLLDGGDDDVRGQGDVGHLHQKALGILLRHQRLDVAPLAAPDVQAVGDHDLRGIKIEVVRRVGHSIVKHRRNPGGRMSKSTGLAM